MNGACTVTSLRHKGYGGFMQVATVQKEASPLAGGLTMVNVQTLAHNLTKPDAQGHMAAFYMWDYSLCKSRAAHQSPEFIGDCHSAKFLAQNLSKPDIGKGAGGSAEGLSALITRGADGFKDTLGGSFATSTREEFLESIKKGSTMNAALFLCASANHYSGASAFALRRSALSFLPQASSTHDEKLALGLSAFSCSTLESISPTISWGNRMPLYVDFAFLCPVAMLPSYERCLNTHDNTISHITKEVFKQNAIDTIKRIGLLCLNTLSTGKAQAVHKIAKPRSARTLTGPLTTTVKPSNEVVMSKHTTPLNGRSAHTQDSERHPVFIWLIAAVRRDCSSIVAVIHHIPAESEQAARRTLAKEHVCFFAGRLNAPRQEVRHAQ